jgi:hypothetical protein
MSYSLIWSCQTPLDIGRGGVACTSIARIIHSNNTPQASLPEYRHDAQTGGLLISGVGNAL